MTSHERVKREALAGRSFLPHLQPKNRRLAGDGVLGPKRPLGASYALGGSPRPNPR
jgi:hypothetical protein